MKWKLCKECGQPMLPKGRTKRVGVFDHAAGCPVALKEIRESIGFTVSADQKTITVGPKKRVTLSEQS